MTPQEWHEHLVRLAMEAYDGSRRDRVGFEARVRERMAQAAQGIAGLEVTTCEDVRGHVRGCEYCGGGR